MRKILILISLLLIGSMSYATDPCQADSSPYGPMTCGAGTKLYIQANGPLTMQDTTVKNQTSVNGPLTADKVNLDDLTVNGSVNITASTVNGETTVNGPLMATKTQFDDTITIASNTLTLTDSTTADLVIKGGYDGIVSPQVVKLIGHTKVDGDIVFKQKDGVVYAGPDVQITGKIIGGKREALPATAKTDHNDTKTDSNSSKS